MVLALKVPWRYNTPYFSDFQHSTLAHTVEMEGGVVGDGVADVLINVSVPPVQVFKNIESGI